MYLSGQRLAIRLERTVGDGGSNPTHLFSFGSGVAQKLECRKQIRETGVKIPPLLSKRSYAKRASSVDVSGNNRSIGRLVVMSQMRVRVPFVTLGLYGN